MILKWYGHSCFSMAFQDGPTLVTDPFDDTVGYPLCRAQADAALISHDHFDHNAISTLAGRPEKISDAAARTLQSVEIHGIETFHDDVQGQKRGKNIVYVIRGDGISLAHLGDLGHMPDEAQLDALRGLDVMLVPIGGTFTIDTEQACQLLEKTRPRLAVAMHFKAPPNGFAISDETDFVRRTGARYLHATQMEILPQTLPQLAGAWIFDYPGKV